MRILYQSKKDWRKDLVFHAEKYRYKKSKGITRDINLHLVMIEISLEMLGGLAGVW